MAQRKRRTRLYLGLGLVLVVLFGIIFARRSGDEGAKVFTEKALNRSIQETVSASGKVFPQVEVKISSDVSGEVVELYVEEGDSVVAGQVLARIDPDAYESQVARGLAGVNTAKAQLANARSQIETFQAQKEQIAAQLQNARDIHRRNDELYKEGVISEADFQASLSSLRSLEANLRAADANIRSSEESARAANFTVQSSEATLNELRTSLRRTTIVAPTSGIISLLNVEKGERVVGTLQMTGTEMMRIANLSAMEVRVEVSENDIPRVSLGDKAEIEVDAYLGRKFTGVITQIANSSTAAALANAALTSDQVTNFEVRISIDPASYVDLVKGGAKYPFRPGMSATVDIFTHREDNALSVPIQAVTTREIENGANKDLQEVVFVVSADSVSQVVITTGIQDNKYIYITSGLQPDQEVVIGPYAAVARELKPGTKVTVVDEETYYRESGDKAQ